MSEQIISGERLASMVKSGLVENYSPSGMKKDGSEALVKDFFTLTAMDSRLGLSPGSYELPKEGFTRVTMVPLSADFIPRDKLAKFDRKGDAVVCMAYYGADLDDSHRNGVMRSFVVMSRGNAQLFTDAVRSSPGLVYRLVRHVNGGPVKRSDGTPAQIKPGKNVEVLANNSVGGSITKTIKSVSFGGGFEANPLL